MKKERRFQRLFFFNLFILFFIAAASAAEFSPGILVYSVEPNQELCQQITIISETLKKFDVSDNLSEDCQIEINYTKEVIKVKREKIIDICIKGNKIGACEGIIFFKDSAEKNLSLSAGAVKLLVDVSEIPQSPAAETQQENPPASSGGGGGGGGSAVKPKVQSANKTAVDKTIQSLASENIISNQADESSGNSSKITGAAVDTNSKLKSIVPIVFILVVIALAVYTKYIKKDIFSYD